MQQALKTPGLNHAELSELAAGLGSDVPFSLAGGTAVGLGRGDRLTQALATGRYHWVLAVAEAGLSTTAVYAECDRLRAVRAAGDESTGGRGQARSGRPDVSRDLLAALRSGEAATVGALLSNDLQPAAVSLRPQLRQALEAGSDHGALGSIVSGSGPTCAFLTRGEEHALDLAAAIAGAGVCRHVARVSGPVAGAMVTQPAAGHGGAP